jgi:hypothetical protein
MEKQPMFSFCGSTETEQAGLAEEYIRFSEI